MLRVRRNAISVLSIMGLLALGVQLYAQAPVILGAPDLEKVVPSSFYFEGQLGPTQMRNAAAVRFADKHNLVAALVDTSGYASSIRSKYEGFLITDRPVKFGSVVLPAGAYGFGFTDDLKMNIFDVGGTKLHSVAVVKDEKLQSPRPLTILKSGDSLRLYRGRTYVAVSLK